MSGRIVVGVLARGVDLLVVGSRGHGGFTEARLGSAGQACVHHAGCPDCRHPGGEEGLRSLPAPPGLTGGGEPDGHDGS